MFGELKEGIVFPCDQDMVRMCVNVGFAFHYHNPNKSHPLSVCVINFSLSISLSIYVSLYLSLSRSI